MIEIKRNNFVVKFMVEHDDIMAVDVVQKYLEALSNQMVAVRLPARDFKGVQPGGSISKLQNISMIGSLGITIAEDAENIVLEALEWLSKTSKVHIFVIKLDDNNLAQIVYRFARCSISSYQCSELNHSNAGSKMDTIDTEFGYSFVQFGMFNPPIPMKDIL